MVEEMELFLMKNNIIFERDVPLSNKTWIKTGGSCAYWIVPETIQQLKKVCEYLYSRHFAFDIVGQTSNLFFHSNCHPQIMVSTVKLNHYTVSEDIITCECGVSVAKLARECLEKGYRGFSGLVGLPGTVAASVYGNASCFDCSIVSMLVNVEVLTPDGQLNTISKEALGFSHRSSAFKRKEIVGSILSVRLKVEYADDIEAEKKKADEATNYRKTKQEKPNWCLGSVYSNMTFRRNGRNYLARLMTAVASKLHLSSSRKAMKRSLLFLYGYRRLNSYVSDKNVNTFIWRDGSAERMFAVYKEFMGKVFNNLTIEIEEREEINAKKKIGILTYHRAENYGALLQAYGMSTFLKKQGYDVSFVDYWPNYHEDYFRIFSLAEFKRIGLKAKLQYLIQLFLGGVVRKRRKRKLQSFMKEHLGLPQGIKYSSKNAVCNEYDVVVYGSDQIWRKQNMPGCKDYDMWYFGSDNIIAKKIAYAGSMGTIQTTPQEDERLKPYFKKFSTLSVRETPLKDYLANMGLPSTAVLDPVFLLDKKDWRDLCSSNKPKQKDGYILFYNLLNNAESTAFVEKLSRETNLPIKEITKQFMKSQFSRRYIYTASVQEFLSLVDNAAYVVSNSFHGVAMSVIFEKQFYAIGMGEKANRVESLLSSLEIGDRYLMSGDAPKTYIDYNSVNDRIAILKKGSVEYLKNAI